MHRKMMGADFIYKFLPILNFVLNFIRNYINYSVWKIVTSILEDYGRRLLILQNYR